MVGVVNPIVTPSAAVALAEAAKTVESTAPVLTRADKRVVTYGPIVPPDAKPPELPVEREQTGIDKLGLPSAAVKALMRAGFETLADLRARRLELPAVKGVGDKSLDAIYSALDRDGRQPEPAPEVEAAPASSPAPVKFSLQLVALPLVVTVGKVAMLVMPDSMRVVDLDSIVGGAPNAVEVTTAFLESTPLADVAPTRLHVMSGASYVDAVVQWAHKNGIPVFGGTK
jgi:hypothetical protein